MKIPQTPAELMEHLKEHVAAMRASIESYDSGNGWEAKRLAHTVRSLVYDPDKGRSTSLLKSLGVKHSLKYLSGFDPSLTAGAKIFCALGMEFSGSGIRYLAPEGPPTFRLSFDDWWSRVFLVNKPKGVSFTCKDAVLYLANQDGGSHVDPELEGTYHQISRLNQFGWNVAVNGADGIVENGPQLPIARQAAGELEQTLSEHFKL